MIAAYIMKVVMVSVIFLMLGVGLRTAFGQIIAVARKVRLRPGRDYHVVFPVRHPAGHRRVVEKGSLLRGSVEKQIW